MPDGGIIVTPDEFHLLTKDPLLLTETLNNTIVDEQIFSFLVKEGSLRENFKRLCIKFSTEGDNINLKYQAPDFFVTESKIIKTDSLSKLVRQLMSAYPISTSIN